MADLKDQVERFIEVENLLPPGAVVVVGVSGGPDSVCLLHLLWRLAPARRWRLQVAHLNHGLRGSEADDDARYVAVLAAGLGVPFSGGQADVAALAARQGHSIEEAARIARYRFLGEVAGATGAGIVAVGHNAGDQAETVLMHFLRGSGPAGLRGMLPAVPLVDPHQAEAVDLRGGKIAPQAAADPHADDGKPRRPRSAAFLPSESQGTSPIRPDLILVRPLLATPRTAIAAYCVEHGLAPRHDRSNDDPAFLRNRLRHELLPLLESYNPGIRSALVRMATLMAGDYEVLERSLDAAWEEVAVAGEDSVIYLERGRWRGLPPALQRDTLRRAIARLGHTLRNVSWDHIEAAVQLGRIGHTGQLATLPGGLALEIGYDVLRLAPVDRPWPAAAFPQLAAAMVLAPGVTALGGGWQVALQRLAREDLPGDLAASADPWAAWLDAHATGDALLLRPRQPGERFQPQGLAGRHASLHEFMIDAHVPRTARAGWPILASPAQILWVCGLRLAEPAALRSETQEVWHVRLSREGGS